MIRCGTVIKLFSKFVCSVYTVMSPHTFFIRHQFWPMFPSRPGLPTGLLFSVVCCMDFPIPHCVIHVSPISSILFIALTILGIEILWSYTLKHTYNEFQNVRCWCHPVVVSCTKINNNVANTVH
jgi:hypothetical protein